MRTNKLILSLLLSIALVPAVQSAQIADAMEAGDFSRYRLLLERALMSMNPRLMGQQHYFGLRNGTICNQRGF